MLNLRSSKVIEVTDINTGEIFQMSNSVDARTIILRAFEQGHEIYITRKEA